LFLFKCKVNSLPMVARTKVLRRNIPEDQDAKIGFPTRRPHTLIADDDAKKPQVKGQKVKIARKADRRKMAPNRAKKDMGRSAHVDRPTLFCVGSASPLY
jgi:hypothetical protein